MSICIGFRLKGQFEQLWKYQQITIAQSSPSQQAMDKTSEIAKAVVTKTTLFRNNHVVRLTQ